MCTFLKYFSKKNRRKRVVIEKFLYICILKTLLSESLDRCIGEAVRKSCWL